MTNRNSEIAPFTRVAAPAAPFEPSGFAPPPGRDVDPRRLWKVIVRRRRLLLAVWIGFALAVALFTLLQHKKYTTQVKMIAGATSSNSTAPQQNDAGTNLPVLNALLAATGVQSSATYAELIQQAPVAQGVARQLGLGVSPAELLRHVQVKPVTDTAILGIDATWKDPETSAKIANAFATTFVARERDLVTHQADSAIAFLRRDLPDVERNMRDAQDALSAYQERSGIADLTTQTQTSVAALAALDAKEKTAEVDAAQAQAQLGAIEQQLAQTPDSIVGSQTVAQNPVAGQLQTQISTLKVQLEAARRQYTDSFPAVIALRTQLAAAERQARAQPSQMVSGTSSIPNPVYQQLTQTAATLQATIASAQSQMETVRAQKEAAKPQLDRLPSQTRRISDLQREAKAAESVYEALQRKYQDALVSRTTALSDVSITQTADPAVFRVSPNAPFNIALGIVLGLGFALAAVFLTEFVDDRFRSEEDVKERLGLPVLATIPLVDASDRDEWVKPLSVESFYQLVASLRYSSAHPPRTIAFTSASQGDGKSSVVVNTAVSLALMNSRVLIIDADLRRPTIHEKMDLRNERGVSDVLVGMARLQDATVPTEHARVFVLPSGRPAPNPVGLLQGEAFDRLLRQAREQFDYVLVDAPALRSIVDGVVLGVKAEGTVLVISAAQSDARSVRAAIDKLRAVDGINLLGVVLNATRPDRRETATNYYLGGGQTLALPPEPTA